MHLMKIDRRLETWKKLPALRPSEIHDPKPIHPVLHNKKGFM